MPADLQVPGLLRSKIEVLVEPLVGRDDQTAFVPRTVEHFVRPWLPHDRVAFALGNHDDKPRAVAVGLLVPTPGEDRHRGSGALSAPIPCGEHDHMPTRPSIAV